MDITAKKEPNMDEIKKDTLAPILLFVYNRPDHAKATIEALEKNELASQSLLYIYSDGAKNDEKDKVAVSNVRKVISNVEGFKKVFVVERDRNIGLGRNIIDGVTTIVNQYGKVIVLEDDIVTSRYFLPYMNTALERYKEDSKVMCVSGYTPPMDVSTIKEETFFMSWPDCWGWGTWKRAWDKFDRNPEKIVKEADSKLIDRINVDGTAPGMWGQVLDNYKGRKYTWAIFFHIAICKCEGLTLYSKHSLTSNRGMDGSGDNSGTTDVYDVTELQTKAVRYYPDMIQKDDNAEAALKLFYKKASVNQSLIKRIINVARKEGIAGIKKRLIKTFPTCRRK